MNNPPPYSDITGIYTVNDKHQDVSKAAYDGKARPAQLVVDTTDYSLWIGNAQGILTEVVPSLQPVAHAELLSLISTNQLAAGTMYEISDFATIYDQPDYDSEGLPKPPNEIVTMTAPIEPLIVLAVSTNMISKQAWSTLYPYDIIEYDISVTETDYTQSPSLGMISWREDEFGNTTPYDSRGVVFKRYEDSEGSGIFTIVNDNGFASRTDIPTFGLDCENIKLSKHNIHEAGLDDAPFVMPNNIFGDYCESTIAQGDFFNNTFGNTCYGLVFGHFCRNNRIGDGCYNNQIGNEFAGNVIGLNFNNNVIGSGFANNTLADNFQSNTIGANFSSNTTAGGFNSNSIEDDFQRNTNIGDNFSNNNIADYFQDNVDIGANCTFNVIYDLFTDNTVGSSFTYNQTRCPVQGKNLTAVDICYKAFTVELIQTATGDPSVPGSIYAGYFNSDGAGPAPYGWNYTGV